MFDELNLNDGIFIVLGSFFITICTIPFLNLPSDGHELLYYMFEVFIITFIITAGLYIFIKGKSADATYLTQERIMKSLCLIFIILFIFFLFNDVYAERKTRHGFAWFILSITIVLILVFAYFINSMMTEKFDIDFPNKLTPIERRLYSNRGDYF